MQNEFAWVLKSPGCVLQDAHEFLNYLLNECSELLEKEAKAKKAAERPPAAENNADSASQVGESCPACHLCLHVTGSVAPACGCFCLLGMQMHFTFTCGQVKSRVAYLHCPGFSELLDARAALRQALTDCVEPW